MKQAHRLAADAQGLSRRRESPCPHRPQFPCLSDNYGFLIRDDASGKTGCIDTPDAAAILRELKSAGWGLDFILNTHWHPDHAGGNAEIQAATGCQIVGPAEVTRIAPLDRTVVGGDTVALGETSFQVIETGGHTLGHIAYFDAADRIAFVGDTLFALGCGRLFEGKPGNVDQPAAPGRPARRHQGLLCTRIHGSNARFALSVDDSAALKVRADEVFAARERGEWTVPTTIGLEKATNPFLRAAALAARVGAAGEPDARAFAAVRAAKDNFRG